MKLKHELKTLNSCLQTVYTHSEQVEKTSKQFSMRPERNELLFVHDFFSGYLFSC